MFRLWKRVYRYFFGPSCSVYVACKMTGREKTEQIRRAHFVSEALATRGIHAISPVIEEKVEDSPGKLVNHDIEKLHGKWSDDKRIIRYKCRVVMLDHGEMKSFGMEREYSLSRGTLWKPTVMLVPPGTPLSVAQFEDDRIFFSVHALAEYVDKHWGTRWDYIKWRLRMINRSLPSWLFDQLYQFIV